MVLPLKITAGDTVTWNHAAIQDDEGNDMLPADWDLKYYFRPESGVAADVVTVTGTDDDEDGWDFEKLFVAGTTIGTWYYEVKAESIVVAPAVSVIKTIESGKITVVGSIASATSYDGRTQTRKDLEAVQTTMRAIISGGAVQEYTVGSRSLKKMPMSELIALESKLKYLVAREETADKVAQGLGNPHSLLVRFRK